MAEELHGLFQISTDLFDDHDRHDQSQLESCESTHIEYIPRISFPKWFIDHDNVDNNIQIIKHQIDFYYYTKSYDLGCLVAEQYIQSNGQMRRDLIEAIMMCALEAGNGLLSKQMLDLLLQHKTKDTAMELVIQHAANHPLLVDF